LRQLKAKDKQTQFESVRSPLFVSLECNEMSCNENDYKSGVGQAMLTDADESVYEAERLIRKRGKASRVEYLVKWKGWSTRYNTWEPLENILDRRLIDQFEKEQSRGKRPKSVTTIDARPTSIVDTSPDCQDVKSLNIKLTVRHPSRSPTTATILHYEPIAPSIQSTTTSTRLEPNSSKSPSIAFAKPKSDTSIGADRPEVVVDDKWTSDSMDWDVERSTDEVYDEESVFVSNYGRCLRRTPARTSAAAALVGTDGSCSDATEYNEPHSYEAEMEPVDPVITAVPRFPTSLGRNVVTTALQPRAHPQTPEVESSRSPSPVRWLPPPELWSSRTELLDQIVVTDVISLDSKITVKECKTKHGFFKNFPPKQKRQVIKS
jgi:hypothetical protein